MVVEAASHVLSGGGVDGLGHVEDAWLPVVLPAGLGPEETLVTDAERHDDYMLIYHQHPTLRQGNIPPLSGRGKQGEGGKSGKEEAR